jgi:hypothetical protein
MQFVKQQVDRLLIYLLSCLLLRSFDALGIALKAFFRHTYSLWKAPSMRPAGNALTPLPGLQSLRPFLACGCQDRTTHPTCSRKGHIYQREGHYVIHHKHLFARLEAELGYTARHSGGHDPSCP